MDGGLMKSMGYMMGRKNGNAPILTSQAFSTLRQGVPFWIFDSGGDVD